MTPTKLSFILATALYSLLLAVGYWLWSSQPIKPQTNPALTKVPVSLAMFAEPIVQEHPAIEQHALAVESATQEPIIKENIIEKSVIKEIKPNVKPEPLSKPLPNQNPIKKEPKKEVNKAVNKPIERPPIKKVIKPVEHVKPTPQPTVTTKEPVTAPPKVQAQPQKPTAPSYSSQQIANAEQRYLNELRKLIVKYAQDTYPRRAKRRHWQGEVVIEFNLMPNGRIVQLHIVGSSGRSILDQAALEIFQVKMANKFKPFPNEVNRKEWQITVPVTYNLL